MRPELPTSRWWPIDPATGKPTSESAPAQPPSDLYLGDDPLDEAGISADNIEATFGASKYFSDDETRRLIHDRELPQSLRPHADASAELLELVDDLWESVRQSYHEKWGRPPTPVERALIAEFTIWVLRRGHESGHSPVTRPIA
jgi:hypothetical protein